MENRYLTVSALTKYIKRKFDFDPHLRNVYVKGEISNYKRHTSGHLYFTLKDEKARIAAVMFSAQAGRLKFSPENGMTVLVRGEITVYEFSGQYQIYVEEMQPDGIGELFLAFEQLKEKLEKEGLFRKERKKPIPPYPETVGVVTSPTGAAIRDIITTIRRRYPIARIIVYPALVQGNQAAPSIVKAIETANERKESDVLIVGRGGGSLEELWAFNEEIVARAVARSEIPIISAVGHETDTTICDFAADLRAPTPTGAAELAVPQIEEVLERIMNRKIRLFRTMKGRVERERTKLERLMKSYAFRNPRKMYEQRLERLDRASERLARTRNIFIFHCQQSYETMFRRLQNASPAGRIPRHHHRVSELNRRLIQRAGSTVKQKGQDYARLLKMLEALNPLKIMERGNSIVYDGEGQIVKSIHQVEIGEQVDVAVRDGRLIAKVMEREEKGTWKKKNR